MWTAGRGALGRVVTAALLPEKAGPPENVQVKEVWGTNALVEWQPPKDNGNSEVTGYFVQKADKKTMVRGRRAPRESRGRGSRLSRGAGEGAGWAELMGSCCVEVTSQNKIRQEPFY